MSNNMFVFMPQGTFLLCQAGAFFAGCLAMFAALIMWAARKNKQQAAQQQPYTQPMLALSPETIHKMYMKQIMNAMLAMHTPYKSDPDLDMLDPHVAQRAIDDLEAEIEQWKQKKQEGETD